MNFRLLWHHKMAIILTAVIVVVFLVLFIKRRKSYWNEISTSEYEKVEEKEVFPDERTNEFDALIEDITFSKQGKRRILVSVTVLIMSFLIVMSVSAAVIYIPCYGYTEDEYLMFSFFHAVTDKDVLQEGSEKYHYYYDDISFDYGDVIQELSEYNYTLIDEKRAIEILRDQNIENNARQVGVHLFSYIADSVKIINIVYFEYENDYYALSFCLDKEDTNKYAYELVTLFSVDCDSLPQELSDSIFENHNQITNLRKNALDLSLRFGAKTAGTVLIAEIAVMGIYFAIKKKKT